MTGRESATWSPLRGAKTVSGAVRAARQIAEAAPRRDSSGEGGDFWLQMAESLIAAFLIIAANTKDRTFADIVGWVVGTHMPIEKNVGQTQPLMRALKADGDPERKAAGEFASLVLEGLWRNDHRTVSGVYATARTMVWPWIDPLVAKATSGCTIDLDWLVLYGEQDFEPIAQAELIAERAGQVDVLVLPGAAHLPWIDQPVAVTDALLTFLRGLRGTMSVT